LLHDIGTEGGGGGGGGCVVVVGGGGVVVVVVVVVVDGCVVVVGAGGGVACFEPPMKCATSTSANRSAAPRPSKIAGRRFAFNHRIAPSVPHR
jgi:hypothetical protein